LEQARRHGPVGDRPRRILPVVLYGREIWFLILKEEHTSRLFENGVLRRIFGPKRDEVSENWRKLHNEELRGSHSSQSFILIIGLRRMRGRGHGRV
jgi:hypothetical protein